jgi:hypothetical protein
VVEAEVEAVVLLLLQPTDKTVVTAALVVEVVAAVAVA